MNSPKSEINDERQFKLLKVINIFILFNLMSFCFNEQFYFKYIQKI